MALDDAWRILTRWFLAVGAAVALAACGSTEPTTEPSPTTNSPEAPSPSPSPSPTVDAQALAEFEECREAMVPLIDALRELDSRLDVGLVNADYSTYVGDISVAYNNAPFKRLSVDCILTVGVPAEDAFNQFIKANNIWDNCIQDFGCDTDSIEPQLQRLWAKATRGIRQSERALRRLERNV